MKKLVIAVALGVSVSVGSYATTYEISDLKGSSLSEYNSFKAETDGLGGVHRVTIAGANSSLTITSYDGSKTTASCSEVSDNTVVCVEPDYITTINIKDGVVMYSGVRHSTKHNTDSVRSFVGKAKTVFD